MELIIVRHGQTAWNVEEVFRGRTDVELDETGLKQAELLAGYLARREIEAVFSSPLKRALITAKAVAAPHGLEAQPEPGLIDPDFGEWEGMAVREIRDRFPEQFNIWVNAPHLLTLPGGDSLDKTRDRAMKVVNDVIAKYQKTVVLVAHRAVNKVIINALLGMDNSKFWNIRQDNAGMTTFTCRNGRVTLVEHNNTSFLQPLGESKTRD